ncbi:MAG TPA: hypothetical protein VLZ54_10640, partial [Arenibacter sp.]|nr:hypothetical protein [Arenibacter sp.]
EHYTSETIFEVHYGNPPDSLVLQKVSKKNINVRLNASGFQLLLFGLKHKSVHVDLSSLETTGAKYYLSPRSYRDQIGKQLSKFIQIVDMDRDTMFFNFLKLYKKKLAVVSNVDMDLRQHYLLDKNWKLVPDSITVIGPKAEILDLGPIETVKITLSPTRPDFSEELELQLPKNLKNTSFSDQKVRIVGKIFRFSERIIQVPISVVNVPPGVVVRTFPETASIMCRDRLDVLKGLQDADFEVSADYAKIKGDGDNILQLKLTRKVDSINVVQLKDDKVEFILMKQ